MNNIIYV